MVTWYRERVDWNVIQSVFFKYSALGGPQDFKTTQCYHDVYVMDDATVYDAYWEWYRYEDGFVWERNTLKNGGKPLFFVGQQMITPCSEENRLHPHIQLLSDKFFEIQDITGKVMVCESDSE